MYKRSQAADFQTYVLFVDRHKNSIFFFQRDRVIHFQTERLKRPTRGPSQTSFLTYKRMQVVVYAIKNTRTRSYSNTPRNNGI